MADDIRLTELVAAMARRGTPLASETGLFIALEVAEAVRERRLRVSVHTVCITGDGEVLIDGGVAGARESDQIAAVAGIIRAVVSPQPPGVRGMLARVSSGQLASLGALRNELHASLVPLNRAAARRVLGRIVRESLRAATPGAEPGRAPAALDTVLDGPPAMDDHAHHGHGAHGHGAHGTAMDTHPDAPVPAPNGALDTEPDGIARALTHGSHATDSVAPPVRRGAKPARDDARDHERPRKPTPRRGDARYEASDEGNELDQDEGDELDRGDDFDDATPSARQDDDADEQALERILRRRKRGGSRATLWLVALLVVAAGGFLVYRLAGPHTLRALPAQISPAPAPAAAR